MGTDLTSKWYWEYTAGSAASPSNPQVFGISTVDGPITNNSSVLRLAATIYTDGSTNYLANKVIDGASTSITTQFRSVAIGDILQIAYDAATGKLWFGKNNTWYDGVNGTSGNPTTGANPVWTLPTGSSMTPYLGNLGATYSGSLNCGQRPFSFAPPTGFKSLNTFNLPDSIVPVGAQYFAATTYTGNNSSTGTSRSITNGGNNPVGITFQPDFVWIKNRSNAYSHSLYDSVRGSGAARDLQSDTTKSEATLAPDTALYGYLSAFNSNGFTTTNGSDAANAGIWVNQNTQTFVAWQWRASNASAVTNTAGDITSQVSANQTAGFSIVTYTGTGANATVGHGLNVTPAMIIIKGRNVARTWAVYHKNLTSAAYYIGLETTNAQLVDTTMFNSTAPTLSVFSVGTYNSTSTNTYVAYCFSEVPGFSKFGSYTGNGAANGPFVYLGFRPRFIMFKSIAAGNNWLMFDTSRNTYNLTDNKVAANSANNENNVAVSSVSENNLDILSNGFKLRTANAQNNGATTIIFAAFAENPFKNALAR
jgi:hypothetical protein